jgi:hypothetical protein
LLENFFNIHLMEKEGYEVHSSSNVWPKIILNNPCSGFELTEFQFLL